LLIVDEDPETRERFEEVRAKVEGDLGVEAHYLDKDLEDIVSNMSTVCLGNEYRANVKGEDPSSLLYTRFVIHSPFSFPCRLLSLPLKANC
jgi:hypothetical protein